MPYAIRNSLILTGLLIVVIIVSLLGNSRISKQKDELELQYNLLVEELNNLIITNPDYDDIERITKEYEILRLNDLRFGKIIPKTNDPTLSYLYLLNISDRFAPDIDFKFEYTKRDVKNKIDSNVYLITGSANIFSFYKFIYHLERNIVLYTIEKIHLEEELVKDDFLDGKTIPNMVTFQVELRSYFQKDLPQTIENSNLRKLKPQYLTYNPFFRRIHEPRMDPDEELYININYINIIGMTPEKIFVRTTSEEIVILAPGDKVAYGYFDRIDWEEQTAIFKINRTGINTEETLYLNKE
jgi:hypothetical protein